jgi:hypothetical protein
VVAGLDGLELDLDALWSQIDRIEAEDPEPADEGAER